MQFIHPLLLWGALAAAVPVAIHLLHRRRFRRQRWAAMEWLLDAAKENRKRLQMENLLLLLVRTAAVLFLALAVARPTLSEAAAVLGPSRQTHLLVVLDNSGSTAARAGTRSALDDGLAAVSSLVAGLRDDDPVSLVLTNDNWNSSSGRPRMILSETRDHGAVRRRLGEIRPAPARADLAAALKLVEERITSSSATARRVAIVTDMQATSLLPRDQREASEDPIRTALARLRDKGVECVLVPAGRDVPNVAVTALRPAEDRDIVQGTAAAFEVELRNFSDRPQRVEVRFAVDGEERGESAHWAELPARSAGPDAPPAVTRQYYTTFRPEDVGVHVLEARVRTDGMPLDDVRSLAFTVRPRIRVLAVDGDPAAGDPARTSETFYLVPALALREDGPVSVRRVTEAEYHELASFDDWDLIVLANVERPAPDDAARKRLESFVAGGGALLLTVGDRVVPPRWNEELWRRSSGAAGTAGSQGGLLPVKLGAASVDRKAVLRLDLKSSRHPLLANINDPDFAVYFGSPVIFGRMSVEGLETERDARTVLAFDDLARSPAILEKRFGRGRVVLLTTTIDEAWGHLPGSYLFPALLHECVYWTTSRGDQSRNLLAFQPWTRTLPANAASVEVAAPDGTPIRTEADQGSVTVLETGQLGVFRATVRFKPKDILGATPPAERDAFAVNLPASESDLRRIEPETALSQWRDLLRSNGEAEADAEAVRAKAGEIAGPLLAAALACLLIEVFLVQRIGRRRAA